jgi:hypothetical protein
MSGYPNLRLGPTRAVAPVNPPRSYDYDPTFGIDVISGFRARIRAVPARV